MAKHQPSWRERVLCRGTAELLIPALRETARAQGYALLSHGSLERDIDLVAIPWVDEAARPETLAEALRQTMEEKTGMAFLAPHEENDFPRKKPHGRLAWAFHLGGGPYVDLSVMPLVAPAIIEEHLEFKVSDGELDLGSSKTQAPDQIPMRGCVR